MASGSRDCCGSFESWMATMRSSMTTTSRMPVCTPEVLNNNGTLAVIFVERVVVYFRVLLRNCSGRSEENTEV
jgi:hypothetical protein